MKRFIGYILISLSIVLSGGCSQVEERSADDIIFRVELSSITAYSAMVTITHNATNRDPYYCFAVEGEVSDVQLEIDRFIKNTPTASLSEYKHYQRKSYFQLQHLRPEKTFSIIAFGMDEANHFYGEPCSVVCNTPKSDWIATENPNWTIEYKGYVLRDGLDFSLITVDVIGSIEERYFLAYFHSDEEQGFHSREELIEYATYVHLGKLKDNTDTDYWLEDSSMRTDGTNFYRQLQEGNYVFYAIGINADGTPTGHYVKTEDCYVGEYPADQKYVNLLGNWIVTDADGCTTRVRFEKRIVNKALWMYGWGGIDDNAIYVVYNRADGSFSINTQIINNDTIISFTSGNSSEGKLTIVAAYYDQESKLKSAPSIQSIATARLDRTGNYIFTPNFSVTLQDNTEAQKYGMVYRITDKSNHSTLFDLYTFPFTMQKK